MNNFDTVSQFIDSVHLGEWTGPVNRRQAREALNAIEADHFTAHDVASASAQGFRDGVASVAQQYEAGDIASASAQGFRDGVASVTQQEPVAWAMPKGDGTFIDVITPAEHAREEGSYTVPLFARPVAQQPQARPDFTDEWAGYLKDGETPFERFLRERKDMQSVLKLYQRVLEENERLKGQQPQAEAVQQKPKLIGWRTSDYLMETSDKDKADNWAVHNEILPIFEGDPYTKLVAAPQQAEAVPSDALGAEWTPCIKRPVIVHVRGQRPGEQHVSTREGITPVKPDDLIMRGVSGEEYPIGRAIFEQTYDIAAKGANHG